MLLWDGVGPNENCDIYLLSGAFFCRLIFSGNHKLPAILPICLTRQLCFLSAPCLNQRLWVTFLGPQNNSIIFHLPNTFVRNFYNLKFGVISRDYICMKVLLWFCDDINQFGTIDETKIQLRNMTNAFLTNLIDFDGELCVTLIFPFQFWFFSHCFLVFEQSRDSSIQFECLSQKVDQLSFVCVKTDAFRVLLTWLIFPVIFGSERLCVSDSSDFLIVFIWLIDSLDFLKMMQAVFSSHNCCFICFPPFFFPHDFQGHFSHFFVVCQMFFQGHVWRF